MHVSQCMYYNACVSMRMYSWSLESCTHQCRRPIRINIRTHTYFLCVTRGCMHVVGHIRVVGCIRVGGCRDGNGELDQEELGDLMAALGQGDLSQMQLEVAPGHCHLPQYQLTVICLSNSSWLSDSASAHFQFTRFTLFLSIWRLCYLRDWQAMLLSLPCSPVVAASHRD